MSLGAGKHVGWISGSLDVYLEKRRAYLHMGHELEMGPLPAKSQNGQQKAPTSQAAFKFLQKHQQKNFGAAATQAKGRPIAKGHPLGAFPALPPHARPGSAKCL